MTSELALWRADLDVSDTELRSLEALLDADELTRAAGRPGERDRRRFVAEHGLRRRLLASLLGRDPDGLAFARDEAGRPTLVEATLRFSAARAGSTALYATSDAGHELGVDVEPLPSGQLSHARLADRILTPAERLALDRVAADERGAWLTRCWTRKEAYAKARGTGLVFPLSIHEVWEGDDRAVQHDGRLIAAVEVGPGLAGAVAVALAIADAALPGGRAPVPRSIPSR